MPRSFSHTHASLQPCDWMETCVLDGLMDWTALGRVAARSALRNHLAVFFHPGTGRRENLKGLPCEGTPGGPETSGPWAALARMACNHPALEQAKKGFEDHYDPRTDSVGHCVVAETYYNIAYPMMAMARFARRPQWQARALRQLEVNRHYLTSQDDLWLRYFPESGERTFQNWSRGVAWYYLGLVRTLMLLPAPDRPGVLVKEIERMAAWVAGHQQPDGLWPCFLKETGVLPDTSGSAGIAAAIALAIRQGMLSRDHAHTARRACRGLMGHLTPDGWLRGVTQSNKRETHAMDIQRSNYRIIAPWGMGLLAQLLAALEQIDTGKKA
jgi:unsaturated rhamnogalacturonyl hydrolase